MIEKARDHMLREKRKYEKRFNNKVRPTRETLHPGVFVLFRREQAHRGESTHKLVIITDGPYEVASLDKSTVTIKIDDEIQRVLRNRVVRAPVFSTGTPYLIENPRPQFVQGSDTGGISLFFFSKICPLRASR